MELRIALIPSSQERGLMVNIITVKNRVSYLSRLSQGLGVDQAFCLRDNLRTAGRKAVRQQTGDRRSGGCRVDCPSRIDSDSRRCQSRNLPEINAQQ